MMTLRGMSENSSVLRFASQSGPSDQSKSSAIFSALGIRGDQVAESRVQRLEARVLRLGGRCIQETSSQQQCREIRKSCHRRTPTVSQREIVHAAAAKG